MVINRREILQALGLGAAALAAGDCGMRSARNNPHIVFIMADDMGYGDVKCYNPGSHIPTPLASA